MAALRPLLLCFVLHQDIRRDLFIGYLVIGWRWYAARALGQPCLQCQP